MEMFLNTWIAWWVGDALGILVVTPLILIWSIKQQNPIRVFKVAEFILVYTIFLYTTLLLFHGFFNIDTKVLPISYVIFPILIWLTLRFSQREVITIIFLLALISIWGTLEGYGTFARANPVESLFYLQSFIGITTITFLLFSTAITERKALERRKDEFISIASHELK